MAKLDGFDEFCFRFNFAEEARRAADAEGRVGREGNILLNLQAGGRHGLRVQHRHAAAMFDTTDRIKREVHASAVEGWPPEVRTYVIYFEDFAHFSRGRA